MNKAIVIGHDGVNTLGLVQSLGREGLYVIAFVECEKSELVRHSKYIKELIPIKDFEEALGIMLERYTDDGPIPVFAGTDTAAMILDQNYECLKEHFLFEHAYGKHSIEQLMSKGLQIDLAKKHDLNVPYSVCLSKPFVVPTEMVYPCIVKPLVSCQGDKRDILIAHNAKDLENILGNQVSFSNQVIIQQFIKRDYEYCMIGCAYKNGEINIPLSLRPVKFNHFLQDTSFINYIEPINDEIGPEVEKIKQLLKDVQYVGLFSAEFMHCETDNMIYFTEINFRNDGTNSFIVHGGVNLPYLHYQDLLNLVKKNYIPTIKKTKKYIWEGIHLSAIMRHEISIFEWIKDLYGSSHFLCYFKDDKKPFYYQFINKIKGHLYQKK